MKAGTIKPWLSLSEWDVHASPGTQQHWALNHCGQWAMEGALTLSQLLSDFVSSVKMWFGVSRIHFVYLFII